MKRRKIMTPEARRELFLSQNGSMEACLVLEFKNDYWFKLYSSLGEHPVSAIRLDSDGTITLDGKLAASPSDKSSFEDQSISDALSFLERTDSTFDIVCVHEVFQHTSDHSVILRVLERLGANTILIEGEFLNSGYSLVEINSASDANTEVDLVQELPATISQGGLMAIAESLGFSVRWLPESSHLPDSHAFDRATTSKSVRAICCLIRDRSLT